METPPPPAEAATTYTGGPVTAAMQAAACRTERKARLVAVELGTHGAPSEPKEGGGPPLPDDEDGDYHMVDETGQARTGGDSPALLLPGQVGGVQ